MRTEIDELQDSLDHPDIDSEEAKLKREIEKLKETYTLNTVFDIHYNINFLRGREPRNWQLIKQSMKVK